MMKFILVLFFINFAHSAFESFPAHYDESTPIFFTLHGCKQNEQSFLKDSFLLERAKEKVIFYSPTQSTSSNIDRCWNWFLPINQIPGPLSEVTSMINEFNYFLEMNFLKNNPVYLIGMSAGAAQAINMLACYPHLFNGAALSAGLPYKVSEKIYDIDDVIAFGPNRPVKDLIKDYARCSLASDISPLKKLIFFHGTADTRVHIKNFVALESQVIGGIDYLDDKKLNNSVNAQLHKTSFHPQDKYPYEVKTYKYPSHLEIKFYTIIGLKHDWSGGKYRVERNDPLGPDATGILLESLK